MISFMCISLAHSVQKEDMIIGKNETNGDNLSMDDQSSDSNIIKLPAPQYDSNTSVEQALLNRRSIRSFSDESITLNDLSQLLWAGYGITKKLDKPDFVRGGLKTAPSAGALYPLEHYVIVRNVSGLANGIYRYNPESHSIEREKSGSYIRKLSEASYGQSMLEECAAIIAITAFYERTVSKYGERGRDRYVCMDAGHSAQNIYLQAYSLKLGLTVCGAFNDESVAKTLDLQPKETPLYLIPIGHPATNK